MFTKTLFMIGLLSAPLISYSAATCYPDIPESTPTNHFTLNADGTAVDNETGLMWQRCSLGQTWNGTSCDGTASPYVWQTALATADINNFAGHTDWRIPNIKELDSIVEGRCVEPAVNETVFPNTEFNDQYWSTTPSGKQGEEAYVFSTNFQFGHSDRSLKNMMYIVRLVRN